MFSSRIGWLLALLLFPIFPSVGQTYNQALVAELDSIARTDQLYRNDSLRQAARNQQEDDANMQKQAAIDQLNLAKIDHIIARHGYPGRSLVGTERQAIAFIVIQHSDLTTQEKYLPVLAQAAAKGELKPSSLAILTDRVRVARGQKQLYGSQLLETKRGVKLRPIEDEANVNRRRAEVGLAPLEDYLKHWHIVYQVPTANHQNPDSLYYQANLSAPASVELIGSWQALHQQLVCPPNSKKLTGDVTIQLTIDKNGVPKDMHVVNSLGASYDKEAIRVLTQARFTNRSGEDHEIRTQMPFSCGK